MRSFIGQHYTNRLTGVDEVMSRILRSEFKPMRKKNTSIPVNSIVNEVGAGIAIERTSFKRLPGFKEAGQSHREDRHTFFLLEAGTVHVEIDFQTYLPASYTCTPIRYIVSLGWIT